MHVGHEPIQVAVRGSLGANWTAAMRMQHVFAVAEDPLKALPLLLTCGPEQRALLMANAGQRRVMAVGPTSSWDADPPGRFAVATTPALCSPGLRALRRSVADGVLGVLGELHIAMPARLDPLEHESVRYSLLRSRWARLAEGVAIARWLTIDPGAVEIHGDSYETAVAITGPARVTVSGDDRLPTITWRGSTGVAKLTADGTLVLDMAENPDVCTRLASVRGNPDEVLHVLLTALRDGPPHDGHLLFHAGSDVDDALAKWGVALASMP